MMMHRNALLLTAACVAALSAEAAAQRRGFGPSIEASAGMFSGGGGTFTERAVSRSTRCSRFRCGATGRAPWSPR
ncbi:MAG TPA: hypothetical protein VK358_09705 [Longimicrobium sp.]|nr:hypothetical protein [Longimicrobium sp.]